MRDAADEGPERLTPLGHVAQDLLALALGDVLHHAEQTPRPLGIELRAAANGEPDLLRTARPAAGHSVLDLVVGALTDRAFHRRAHPFAVLSVHLAEEPLEALEPHPLLRIEAVDLVQPRVAGQPLLARVQHPTAESGDVERRLQLRAELRLGILTLASLGDVARSADHRDDRALLVALSRGERLHPAPGAVVTSQPERDLAAKRVHAIEAKVEERRLIVCVDEIGISQADEFIHRSAVNSLQRGEKYSTPRSGVATQTIWGSASASVRNRASLARRLASARSAAP